MEQLNLLPSSLEELVPEDHLVQVVNRVIEQTDIKP
jgi:transposase